MFLMKSSLRNNRN